MEIKNENENATPVQVKRPETIGGTVWYKIQLGGRGGLS
jgi:hypothetical protein